MGSVGIFYRNHFTDNKKEGGILKILFVSLNNLLYLQKNINIGRV